MVEYLETSEVCMSLTRPLHVLALSAEAYGGRGGIAQSTRDLLEALAKIPQIGRIDILPRHTSEREAAIPSKLRQYPACPGRVAYARKALWMAVARRPDIVYCGHAFMAPLAQLAARVAGARLISHVHGLEVWQPLSSAARRGLAASDVILCVSNHTAAKVAGATGVNPARCSVIFNTVDERFTPGDWLAARARFGLTPQARVLSTVSRLDPGQRHKGHDRVIPLLAGLARDIPNLVYLIAGTGGDQERLAALAESHGAAGLVRFLGYVPSEELPDLYRASDLYVMPSHGEGFGIAFVEAMACGTPALGLAVGGAEDALGNGALGFAVTESEFPTALKSLAMAPPQECLILARKSREMFGRPRFEYRLAEVLAPILAGASSNKEAFP